MASEVKHCNCKHEVQDKMYGKGNRLMNEYNKGYRCTVCGKEHNEGEYFMQLAQSRAPETIANMAIVLIKQADYLLHRQIQRLSDDFAQEGGFSERMTRIRKEYRGK